MNKRIVLLIGICLLSQMFFSTSVFAASDMFGKLPWDSTLYRMVSNVQTIARPIVAVLIAVTGVMVLFDAGSTNAVKCARIVLGIGLALNVSDLIMSENGLFKELFFVLDGNVDKPLPPNIILGGEDNINFVGQFMTYYQQMCIYGAQMLIPSALKLLAALVVIDMTMTLVFKLEGDHIQYLLHQILKVGFFIFLIQNWIGGVGAISNIANTILTSFEQIGINATGLTSLKPENILVNGVDVVTMIVYGLPGNILDGNIILAIVQVIIALAAFVCVAITACELILCRLLFWTIALIIVPIIPFGCYQHTRFLFERAIGAVFNMGIKMGIITFICIVTGPMLAGLLKAFKETEGFIQNIVALLMVLFGTLVIAMLAKHAPALASGYFNGQPSLGGASMTGMAMSAARAASGAAGAIAQASNMAGGATALKSAGKAGGQPTNFGLRQLGTMKNNSAQSSTQDRMNRNKGNSDAQDMGRTTTTDNQGKVNSGWKPMANANQQNTEITQRLEALQKQFNAKISPSKNQETETPKDVQSNNKK